MQTFTTPTAIALTIEISIGDVRIDASARTDTVVAVHPSDPTNADDRAAAERVRIEHANEQLVIRSPKLDSWVNRRGGSVDVTIELPADSHVHGTLGMGDLRCTGRIGECRIRNGVGDIQLEEVDTLDAKSGTGKISVEHATGRVEVSAGSGDVRMRELDAPAVIKNSNGDTWVGTAHDELRIQAANGRIAVDRTLADVSARSSNGNVRLDEVVRGSVILESKLGNLEVGVPEGTAAWIDASAKLGKVLSELDQTAGPTDSAETVDVRARTTLGRIVIRRPSRATAI